MNAKVRNRPQKWEYRGFRETSIVKRTCLHAGRLTFFEFPSDFDTLKILQLYEEPRITQH